MNYQEQLNPWVIHQLLPDLTHSVVMRFRRRNDAECYLRVLNHMRPNGNFAIAFEVNNVIETITASPAIAASTTKGTSETTKSKAKTKDKAKTAKNPISTTFVPM
jgi:hypothetical protein